jgi:hypothetical protein
MLKVKQSSIILDLADCTNAQPPELLDLQAVAAWRCAREARIAELEHLERLECFQSRSGFL